MTTIQIQVNDDSIVQKIMAYLKQFKLPVQVLNNDDDEDGVPMPVALKMVEGLKQIKQYERGEIELQSFEELIAELKAEETQPVENYESSYFRYMNAKEVSENRCKAYAYRF